MGWIGILIALVLLSAAYVFVRTALQPAALTPETPTEPAASGFAVLICHRELPGPAKQSLELAWGTERARLVRAEHATIGYQSYSQIHRVSRWHIVSILLQLSRSWPIVALVSFLRGLPITSPRFTFQQRKREAWDMVELFNFGSAAMAVRFLEDAALSDLRSTLNENAEKWTSYRQAIPMQVTTALDRRLAHDGVLFNLFFLRARDHLGRQAMLEFWLQQHRPFALQQQPVLQYNVYHQYIAQETEQMESTAGSLSSGEAIGLSTSWDGVAAVGFAGMPTLLMGIPNPRVQAANFRLVFDEVRFIDIKRSSLVLGHVRHYHS